MDMGMLHSLSHPMSRSAARSILPFHVDILGTGGGEGLFIDAVALAFRILCSLIVCISISIRMYIHTYVQDIPTCILLHHYYYHTYDS